MKKKALCYGMVAVFILTLFVVQVCAENNEKNKNDDRILSKVKFIHFKKGHAKPPWAVGDGNKKEEDGIYSYIAKGAHWRTIEDLLPLSHQHERS